MKVRGQQVYSAKERIARMIVINEVTGCWEWQGYHGGGYGRLVFGSRADGNRKTVSAHRLSYETYIGEIPDGMEVCHKCDVKKCCNPEHLFTGSRQDNIDDRERKGRNNHVIGEKVGNSKLTDKKVMEMRSMRASGVSFQKIADHFSINKKTAIQACKAQLWKHIPCPAPQPPEPTT